MMADEKPSRKIMVTADGSHTVAVPAWQVSYHSKHGAIQESMHVFIDAGFNYLLKLKKPATVRILEMGFGTGLNALLTMEEAEKKEVSVYYEAVELFPLEADLIKALNYGNQAELTSTRQQFEQLHTCSWNESIVITPFFTLKKVKSDFSEYPDKAESDGFDLVYFDAFAPAAQPELWSKEIFKKLIRLMKTGGLLVTYCSKGEVRRAMQSAGWEVEKIPGPPGKREMVRARKSNVGM